MIERIKWHENPFSTKSPLKITFHSESLKYLPQEEEEALELLYELTKLSSLSVLQTEPGRFTHMQMGDLQEEDGGWFPVRIDRENGEWTETAVPFPINIPERDASRIRELAVAQAHFTLKQHILVTNSSDLLKRKDDVFNPRTPCEAAQIVGLFLRSRDIYMISIGSQHTHSFDRGGFYWTLMRYRLQSMWRYFSACVDAWQVRQDDTLVLGQSILDRCLRALQARDAIGQQFYSIQHNGSRDEMLYHFDYLTLLIGGVFDAMARLAYRAYRLNMTKGNVSGSDAEKDADFRNKNFRRELKKSNYAAGDLYKVISGQHFTNFTKIFRELRNTIHGAALTSFSVGSSFSTNNDESYIQVPNNYQKTLWNAAKQSWTPEEWGLSTTPGGLAAIEPYTFACMLVSECLKFVNEIAEATDITGLFPDGSTIPSLPDGPPNDNAMFGEEVGRRLAILG